MESLKIITYNVVIIRRQYVSKTAQEESRSRCCVTSVLQQHYEDSPESMVDTTKNYKHSTNRLSNTTARSWVPPTTPTPNAPRGGAPRLLVAQDAVRVLQGLDFGVAALHLDPFSAYLGIPLRVMFFFGHGCVVLGLCCIDAVRQPSLFPGLSRHGLRTAWAERWFLPQPGTPTLSQSDGSFLCCWHQDGSAWSSTLRRSWWMIAGWISRRTCRQCCARRGRRDRCTRSSASSGTRTLADRAGGESQHSRLCSGLSGPLPSPKSVGNPREFRTQQHTEPERQQS